MGLPGAGPLCSRLGTGTKKAYIFFGSFLKPIFSHFWSPLWVPFGLHFRTFFVSFWQLRFLMIFGTFWERFWEPSQPQKLVFR